MTDQSFVQRVWNPGLANGELRLRDLYRTLPAARAGSIPWYVKALESPRSPLALPGAVDSFAHDCIHIVLGRGLLAQDEAFVLGFTLGAARAPGWRHGFLRHCARHLYTGGCRFTEQDAEVFDFAFDAARRSTAFALHRVGFRKLLERPLAEIRRFLGIDVEALRELYATERKRWPLGYASQRLPDLVRNERAGRGRVVHLAKFRQARALSAASNGSRSAAFACKLRR